jgi:hypothetical protein
MSEYIPRNRVNYSCINFFTEEGVKALIDIASGEELPVDKDSPFISIKRTKNPNWEKQILPVVTLALKHWSSKALSLEENKNV